MSSLSVPAMYPATGHTMVCGVLFRNLLRAWRRFLKKTPVSRKDPCHQDIVGEGPWSPC